MIICICLDKKNGMAFFGKRQSQDSVQRRRLLEAAGEHRILMNAYSARLFGDLPNLVVDENFLQNAEDDDFCFVENTSLDLVGCSRLILYRWNRHYPADVFFSADLRAEGFRLVRREDFEGSSHEKITEEIYERG